MDNNKFYSNSTVSASGSSNMISTNSIANNMLLLKESTPTNTKYRKNNNDSNNNNNNNNNKQMSYSKKQALKSRNKNKQKNNDNIKTVNTNIKKTYDFEQDLQEQIMTSHFKSGTKKAQISINHLLDLQFQPTDNTLNSNNPMRKKQYQNHTNGGANNDNFVHLQGASYINATYKFIVQDKFNYKEQFNDPNCLIKPEKIIRVVMMKDSKESLNCPICLSSDIIAPRMVLCGHLFCHTCLLQFFEADSILTSSANTFTTTNGNNSTHNSNSQMHKPLKKKFHECPLCASIIRENSDSVLPVLFESSNIDSAVGHTNGGMDFQLICRPHGSIIGLPVSLGIDPMKCEYPPNISSIISNGNYQYSRIVQTDVLQQIQYYKNDIKDINEQYQLDQLLYNDDGKFVKLAIKQINETIESLLEKQLSDLDISHRDHQGDQSSSYIGSNELVTRYDDKNAYFYYEHVNEIGKRFFLSALDVKILKKKFGSYSKFPWDFPTKLENCLVDQRVCENSIQTFKYFGHLPNGDTFNLVDIDWKHSNGKTEPLIDKFIMEQFQVQLKSRKSKINRKKLKEDHEKKVYEKNLEIEHYKFYEQENGSWSVPHQTNHFPEFSALEIESQSLAPQDPTTPSLSSSSLSSTKEFKKTIWGTVIPKSEYEEAQEQDKENWLPQDILDQIDNLKTTPTQNKNSNSKKKGNQKGKAQKLNLFSNSQRGTS